jgi:choline dehydrogenase
MLSGIGPEAELRRLGLPALNALEGIGANYQDHPLVTMTFEGPSDFHEDWVVPKFRLVWKSDSSRPCGDFHLMMRPPTEVPGLKRMMPLAAFLIEQRNRGRLYLETADPDDQPVIESRILEDPGDIAAMRGAMQFLFDLVQNGSMRDYYGPLISPGPKEDWETFARSSYSSYQHGVGTCMMGPATNPMAVVDQELRVHGMDNLRVADASIMPTVAHANTNVTVIMIAERASDFIQSRTQ